MTSRGPLNGPKFDTGVEEHEPRKEASTASILTFPVSRRATWRRLVRATRDNDTERLVQQEVRRLKLLGAPHHE